MKLLLVNGSPRAKGTTNMLLEAVKNGFKKESNHNVINMHLREKEDEKLRLLKFLSSDIVIIGFPLYTDAMPGMTKEFFEQLREIKNMSNKPSVGFLIQSGFPEAKQSYFVERYCKKLISRLKCEYLGSVIIGNCNRIELQPKFMTNKIFKNLNKLGQFLSQKGKFDYLVIKKLLIPEELSFSARFLLRLINLTPLGSFYWDNELRKNNQYKNHNAKPYQMDKSL